MSGDGTPIYGVAANGQRLDEGELFKGELAASMEFVSRQDQSLTHAAIAMHAQHLECLTAVRASLFAGMTMTAVQVGLDGAVITDLKMIDTFSDGQHLDPELMPQDARELNEGHLSQIAADIGAADTNGADGYQSLTCRRWGWLGGFDPFKGLSSSKAEGFHG